MSVAWNTTDLPLKKLYLTAGALFPYNATVKTSAVIACHIAPHARRKQYFLIGMKTPSAATLARLRLQVYAATAQRRNTA